MGHGLIKGHLSAWLHALSITGRHGRGLALAAFPAFSAFRLAAESWQSKPLFDVDPSLGVVPFVTWPPSRMLGWGANKLTKLN
jgi:hypothetical protein